MRTGAWKFTSITWAMSAAVRRVTGMRAGMPALFTRQSTPSSSRAAWCTSVLGRGEITEVDGPRAANRGCAPGTPPALRCEPVGPPGHEPDRRTPLRRASARARRRFPTTRRSRRSSRPVDLHACSLPGSAVRVRRRWRGRDDRRRRRRSAGTPECSSGERRRTARTLACSDGTRRRRPAGWNVATMVGDVDRRPVDQAAARRASRTPGSRAAGDQPVVDHRAVVPGTRRSVRSPFHRVNTEGRNTRVTRPCRRCSPASCSRRSVRRRSRGAFRCGLRCCFAFDERGARRPAARTRRTFGSEDRRPGRRGPTAAAPIARTVARNDAGVGAPGEEGDRREQEHGRRSTSTPSDTSSRLPIIVSGDDVDRRAQGEDAWRAS